jgi:hypothetical protein
VADAGDQPLFVALTLDVDPDANRPAPGRLEAVSAGAGEGVRLDGCLAGLTEVLDLLEETELPATFFWEGRTLEGLRSRQPELIERIAREPGFEHGCHGYGHEDFAAGADGRAVPAEAAVGILRRAGAAIADAFGAPPRAFRAPYCRMTDELAAALVRLDYAYDASLTREAADEWALRPYPLQAAGGRLWELALCRTTDPAGRPMSGYLWQLFEGRRPVADYVHLLESLRDRFPGGLLQIALHPWHLVVSEDGSPLPGRGRDRPGRRLGELLGRLTCAERLKPTTAGAYLAQAI